MIELSITLYSIEQRLVFDDLPSAEAALMSLRKELNKDKYARNEKAENVHTIQTPAGPVDVVLERVQCARIIDRSVWTRQSEDNESERHRKAMERDLQHRRAILELEREFQAA